MAGNRLGSVLTSGQRVTRTTKRDTAAMIRSRTQDTSMTIVWRECCRHFPYSPPFPSIWSLSPSYQEQPIYPSKLQVAIVMADWRTHSTPEQFTAAVAAYYEQKTSYNQQYNNWLTRQSTPSTLNLRPKDNMPAHEAEENVGGAAGSTYNYASTLHIRTGTRLC